MKLRQILSFLVMSVSILCLNTLAMANGVTVHAPKITLLGSYASDPFLTNLTTGLQAEVDAAAKNLENQLNQNTFPSFTDLSRGFANASALTSYAGTNQSFQNYDLFSIMVGANMGFALPGSNPSDISKGFNSFHDKGDVYLGAGASLAVNVGLKVPFIFDNLYVSGKFGSFTKHNIKMKDTRLDIDQTLVGFGLNYSLIQDYGLLGGLARWRGISLGSGLIYTSSKYTFNAFKKDQSYKFVDSKYSTITAEIDASNIEADLSIKSSSLTVPFDAVTSMQMFWLLNFGFGAGIDINIPTSSIDGGGSAAITAKDTSGLNVFKTDTGNEGSVSISDKSTSKAKFTDIVSPKLMASLGLNISIVKLDLPLIYYPFSKAFSIGICAGIVW
jgi:hypothetical protein